MKKNFPTLSETALLWQVFSELELVIVYTWEENTQYFAKFSTLNPIKFLPSSHGTQFERHWLWKYLT